MLCESLPLGYIITNMNFSHDKFKTNYSNFSWFFSSPNLREGMGNLCFTDAVSAKVAGNTRRFPLFAESMLH